MIPMVHPDFSRQIKFNTVEFETLFIFQCI
jgi:hypothetical protein